jgi:2-dehydropantoate 2-reductase
MSEKPIQRPRYVIFGAGAIGGAIGALLTASGSPVVLVARPATAEALKRGVRIKRDGQQMKVKAAAVTSISQITPAGNDVVLLTTKSQATESAIKELASVYDRSLRIVCLQNGIRNEEIAASSFDKVYAGLVLFTAVQLDPEVINLPRGRQIAIGCYPSGVDDLAFAISDDLRRAGFDCIASAHVMAMKWAKLIANLNNATHAITGYWMEKAMADPEMRRLMYEVRIEGLRVLDVAGIAVEPPAGEPSPIRVREETEKLKQLPDLSSDADSLPYEQRRYPSMWQDLKLGRKTNEAGFLNGEIIELGKKLGIPTPYNQALLEIVNRMSAEGIRPGLYTPAELHAVILSRAGGCA